MSTTNYETVITVWLWTNNDFSLHCKNMWHVYTQTIHKPKCIVYMQYNQLWHIFILSDYHIHAINISISWSYDVYTRSSIANVHFLPLESSPIAAEIQLWCSRPQRSPSSVASHCPVLVVWTVSTNMKRCENHRAIRNLLPVGCDTGELIFNSYQCPIHTFGRNLQL